MTINRSDTELSGISESKPTPRPINNGRSAGSVAVKSLRLKSVLSLSNTRLSLVLAISGRHISPRPEPDYPACPKCGVRVVSAGMCVPCRRKTETPPVKLTKAGQEAYNAWMSGGSAGLGLWLAGHKEQTTWRRYFTVEEYDAWVKMVRAMELQLTGKNNEFCTDA